MKRIIFVTGGLGFIGSHFLRLVVPKYPDIDFVNIDNFTYAADFENISDISTLPNYFFEQWDISDADFLEKIFKKYVPTDIIHFAAETHVDNSIKNPFIFEKTNVFGTLNLLEFHKNFSPKWRFCYISTDEVYGDSGLQEAIFHENSPMKPSSPYSASKAAAEHFVQAYARTFSLDTVIIRPTNHFGTGQFVEKFIPISIFRLLRGEKIKIYGNGSHKRTWLYTQDGVAMMEKIFFAAKSWEIYNVVGKKLISNLELAQKILEIAWGTSDKIEFIEDRKGHDFCYAVSGEKYIRDFGEYDLTDFDTWLSETFEFYKKKLWKL